MPRKFKKHILKFTKIAVSDFGKLFKSFILFEVFMVVSSSYIPGVFVA
jgi:hypothetical protein